MFELLMPLLQGEHLTRFTYSAPVQCDPLLIRLRPREESSQRLREFRLEVAPRPRGMSDWTDADGNSVTCCWWDEPTDRLEIRTQFVVETRRQNPFDFLLFTDAATLPVRYAPSDLHTLAPHRQASGSREVAAWAAEIASAARGRSMMFLGKLCETIHAQLTKIDRVDGPPWSAARTLAEGKGACRDLAMLFIDACRSQGLAARFVSGYAWQDAAQAEHDLHAWAEVYLPGGGWRGFDPSTGLATADHHIAVAACAVPDGAAPTTGTIQSRDVTTDLHTDVRIQPLPRWQ